MSKSLSILCLFPSLVGNGGIQRFNRTLLDVSQKLDIQVKVISLTDGDESLKSLTYSNNIALSGCNRGRLRFVFTLLWELWSRRWDMVLIGHVNLACLTMALLPWTRARRARTILVAHGIDVWGRIGLFRHRLIGKLWCVLAVSDYTRDSVLQQVPGLAAHRCLVFPNALAESWLAQQNRHAECRGEIGLPRKFVLSVTRLASTERYKGIVSVIESIGSWADCELNYVVVGHGDDVSFLKSAAQRFGVAARVTFLSGLSDEALRAVYSRASIFALPSGKEGFGIVFLEAMHFGLPVIAARARGAVDVVRHMDTGLLVEYGDVVGIADAVSLVLNNHELRNSLINSARRLVDTGGEFTSEAMSIRWQAILSRIRCGI